MNAIQKHFSNYRLFRTSALLTLIGILMIVGVVYADVPTRVGVRGTVPNPGTQQQELPNITIPAPYNVFEIVVTCMACGGVCKHDTGPVACFDAVALKIGCGSALTRSARSA